MLIDRHRIWQWIIVCVLLLIGSSASLYAQFTPKQPMPIVEERVESDGLTNRYVIHTYVGGQELDVPIILTPTEYMDWKIGRAHV